MTRRGNVWMASALAVTMVLAPATAGTAWASEVGLPGVPTGQPAATQGLVSASHPLAAEAGRQILAQGGNAVDAAAAVQMALNVVEPMMSGIGGGGFLMIYLKEQNKVAILDSRETAPGKSTPQLFLGRDGNPIPFAERHTNGNAVGVPGTLLGVETALAKYGTMNLSQVTQPAIHYASEGVPVNWATAKYIADNAAKLQKWGTAGAVFVPNGQPLKEGETLKQPELANTLKLVAEQGADVLYQGELGDAIVAEVQRTGGMMTKDDLLRYQVKEREAVRGTYRGYEVVSMSPPSSGGLTVLEILKLMEGYNLPKMGHNSPDYLHRLIEAMHLSYADRAAYLADEDFRAVPRKGLLDDRYIAQRREGINPHYANAAVKAGDPWKYEQRKQPLAAVPQTENPTGQTTHFSVVDKAGNLVAYTTTIEQVFGSGIMVPGYGVMLNNEMTDFDAVPGGVNQVEPYKRPLSSMSPTLVLQDGKPFMALGSPGGPTIIASVAQTLMNVIDFRMPIQEAILAPGIYSSAYPTVRWEPGLTQDARLELTSKGHSFEAGPTYIGNVQGVIFDYTTGKMYGGADNTRQGTVLGVDGGVTWTAPQAPVIAAPTVQLPFKVKRNGASLPYSLGQLMLQDGTSYVEAEKLLLGLGAKGQDFSKHFVQFGGTTQYLPVRKVAESLGYVVEWDAKTATVLLTKEHPTAIGDAGKWYSEDEFKITK